eukprot:TRINITY_DN60840_c0_g1_i1.p1 TRINITY_DN60840_c0_g1~~TRINITY_DN60840_c0_g1_i1.p1  ORF type:complete len:471 (+),score=67.82 TRINITY_DN60840_c0_g1_i1:88-1500(+)
MIFSRWRRIQVAFGILAASAGVAVAFVIRYRTNKQKLLRDADNTNDESGDGDRSVCKTRSRLANARFVAAVRRVLAADALENMNRLCAEALSMKLQTEAQAIAAAFAVSAYQEAGEEVQVVVATPDVSPGLPGPSELEIVGPLGCGGFSKVELCLHRGSGQMFAVKTISKAYVKKVGMQENVRIERLALIACRSPFVMKLRGVCNLPSTLHLIVEPLLGGELWSTYKRHGLHGSVPHARYYIASVACSIRHLHSLHIVSRGIKPEDFVLDGSGRLKMVDLGLAKFIVEKTFTTCGTPDYFSPELIQSSGHGFATDWWALGVMLYELLAGNPPFESPYPMQIYSKVMRGTEKIIFHRNVGGLAKDLVSALLKARPSERLPVLQDGWERFDSHPWYVGFDWSGLLDQSLRPPHEPTVNHALPLSNFSVSEQDFPQVLAFDSDGSEWSVEWGEEYSSTAAFPKSLGVIEGLKA